MHSKSAISALRYALADQTLAVEWSSHQPALCAEDGEFVGIARAAEVALQRADRAALELDRSYSSKTAAQS